MDYKQFSKAELQSMLKVEKKNFKKLQKQGVSVDMTRGRPSAEQLDIAMPMLKNLSSCSFDIGGVDARNYSAQGGIKPARELFASIFGVKPSEVAVGDGSSLDLMYTCLQFAMMFGVRGGSPWGKLRKVKFICPAPGYDRHFAICEELGIDMITVPMLDDGPDMDMVEGLVSQDDAIKGIWCVPKYSNPTGIVFSDKVVERLGSLKPAASDFCIMWDNSYILHSLYDTDDKLKNIFEVAKKAGNSGMVYSFTSTSKITFAGGGISAIASSEENINEFLKHLGVRQICPNKINQLAHVAFLKDVDNIKKIMSAHAAILRPKFVLFEEKFSNAFADDDFVVWSKPRGGYFISVDVKGLAKQVVELCAQAGVLFTQAGATFPYHTDDKNSNIRIAPSVPTLDQMDFAIDVLICAIKVARMEQLLKEN